MSRRAADHIELGRNRQSPKKAIDSFELARVAGEEPLRIQTEPALDVLLIDDDPADAMLVVEAVHGNPFVGALTVLDAPNVALTLLMIGELKPDLILLDIRLPKMDGFQFAQALRDVPGMARVRIVMLTSLGFGRDIDAGRSHGISDIIVKPESLGEMRTRLDGVFNQMIAGRAL